MSQSDTQSEREILSAYASGRAREGYTLLAKHYRSSLVRLFERRLGKGAHLRGNLADDLVQDTLERVHRRLSAGTVKSVQAMLYLQSRSIFQRSARRSHDALDYVSLLETAPLSSAEAMTPPALYVIAHETEHADDSELDLDSGAGAGAMQADSAAPVAPGPYTLDIPDGPCENTLPRLELELVGNLSPDSMLRVQRLRAAFLECLRALPNARHRRAFERWLLGDTYERIAVLLGWRGFEGAVSAVRSARKLLLACLRQRGEDLPEEL